MCIRRLPEDENDDISLAPRPRGPREGDVIVRRRPSHSARASKVIEVQHASHQSIRIAVRPGQIVRVSSTRGSRVEQASSPVSIPLAAERVSYILGSDQHDGRPLVHSVSPPIAVHAPTPPRAVSPRASHTLVTHYNHSPRGTQQSFHSQHSYHSQHSSRSNHSRRHSRSGSNGGRRSNTEIVDPPVTETYITRSRSVAGQRYYSPASPPHGRYRADGRVSMPSVIQQRSASRERSQERTSTGRSFLNPLPHEVEAKKIQQGLTREDGRRVPDGQVKGLLGNEDAGELYRIVVGRGPRMSAGRLGTSGERNFVVEESGRRQYGSQ